MPKLTMTFVALVEFQMLRTAAALTLRITCLSLRKAQGLSDQCLNSLAYLLVSTHLLHVYSTRWDKFFKSV